MTLSLAIILLCLAIGRVGAVRHRELRVPLSTNSAIRNRSQYDNHRLFEYYQGSDGPELQGERLKGFALHLQHALQFDAWILSYAGKRACRSEAKLRGEEAKKYLMRNGIKRSRIKVIDGGHHENWGVELWLVVRGTSGPTPKPSVKRQDVQLIQPKSMCPKVRL